MLRVIVPLLIIAIVVFTVVDVALIDRSRVRAVPRWAWILIVVALPVLGSVLWFALGRARGGNRPRSRRPVAPDDDPEFLARVRREQQQRERINDLERQLAELEDDDPDASR